MKQPVERKHRKSVAEGFTLVEMMVAVTLVALMALLLWSVLRSSISSWKRGTESIDANQRHRTTLDLLEKQMASMYPLVPLLDLQLGTGVTPVFGGSASGMQFVSLCSFRFQANPGLTLVSYEVVRGSEGDCSLVERETRYLGGDPTQQASYIPDDEPATAILEHLDTLEFEYYDPGTLELPPKWIKEWNSVDQKRLPMAVSLTMVTRDANGARQSRQLVVPILTKPDNALFSFTDPFEDRRRRLGADDPSTRR
jgi:general secretion pathway protein J